MYVNAFTSACTYIYYFLLASNLVLFSPSIGDAILLHSYLRGVGRLYMCIYKRKIINLNHFTSVVKYMNKFLIR